MGFFKMKKYTVFVGGTEVNDYMFSSVDKKCDDMSICCAGHVWRLFINREGTAATHEPTRGPFVSQ